MHPSAEVRRSTGSLLLPALIALLAATSNAQTRATIWSDDLESGGAGWTHAYVATQDDWQIGAPTGITSYDPTGAHSGTKAWANDLGLSGWDGLYKNNVKNYLESPAIDCRGYKNVQLELWRFLTVERSIYDKASIFVNGYLVWQNSSSTDQRDTAWTSVFIGIGAWADGQQQVKIRFELESDDSVTYGGWAIDDVKLTGEPADMTAPYVTATDPVNGATKVSIYARPLITFSEVMDTPSSESALTIVPAVSKGIRWPGDPIGLQMEIAPDQPLAANTTYTVSLSSAAKDLAGNPLQPYTFSFTTGAADTTPPTVVKSYPTQGLGDVPIASNIVVTFSEPVNRADAEANFKFSAPNPAGTFSWDQNTLVFDPTEDMQPGTKYTFSESNVRDLSGNVMTDAYVVDFTTVSGGPTQVIFSDNFDRGEWTWKHTMKFGTDDWQMGAPKATSYDPGTAPSSPNVIGNTLGGNYPPNTHNWTETPAIDATNYDGITLTFKRWLTIQKGQNDRAAISVNGEGVWLNPDATDLIDTGWTEQTIDISAQASHQIFTVKFELVSDGSVQMGGWNIDDVVITGRPSQGNVPPSILSTSPVNGATGVAPATSIAVEFSEPMDASTVETAFSQIIPYIGGAMAWNGNTATFVPDGGSFAPSTFYRLNFFGTKDLSGAYLSQNGFLEFTTGAFDGTPPVVTSTTPGNGGSIKPYDSISFAFSEPMSAEKTAAAVVITPYLYVEPLWSGNTLTLKPRTPWIAGSYTATVTKNAQGTDGNYLTADVPLSFTVQAANPTPPPVRLFYETFETGAPGWTHGYTAGQDDWQLGTPSRTCPYDPGAAYAGTKAYGNDLGGSGWNGYYGNSVSNWLKSKAFATTGYKNVTLTFRRWLTVQSSTYDQARIKVNGTTVWTNTSSSSLIDTSWKSITLNIGTWADNRSSVQLQWTLTTNSSTVYGGWNIDQVEVWGTPITNSQYDSDGDGMEDAWETFFFGNLAALPGGDADSDGLTNLVEHGLRTSPMLKDSDNDGLEDGWEKNGRGSVNLPAFGASPLRRDIFVEADWMMDYRPTDASVQTMVNNLAAKDVYLHVDTGNLGGGSQIGYVQELPFGAGPDQADLYTFKYGEDLNGNGLLDTALSEPADQKDYNRDGDMLDIVNEDVTGDGTLEPRRFHPDRLGVFHYVIFCNVFSGSGYSGLANINDDDFIIAWNNASHDDTAIAGLFLHELGHNMNLGVTRETHDQGPPAYESCMNYMYVSTKPSYSQGLNQIADYNDYGFMRPYSIREWAVAEDGRGPASLRTLYLDHDHRTID